MGEKGNIVEGAGVPAPTAGTGEALITTVVSQVADVGAGIAGHAADVAKEVATRVVGDRISERYGPGRDSGPAGSGQAPAQPHRSGETADPEALSAPPAPADDPGQPPSTTR